MGKSESGGGTDDRIRVAVRAAARQAFAGGGPLSVGQRLVDQRRPVLRIFAQKAKVNQ